MRRSLFYRIVFQVHLWGGLLLGLYALAIGVTGSVLVFREEIVDRIAPAPRVTSGSSAAGIGEIHSRIQSHYPDWNVWSLEPPRDPDAPWSSFLLQPGRGKLIFADAQGNVIGERHLEGTWFELFERFHSNLLIRNGGRLYNGIAGLILAFLALSGLYLWWPRAGEWSTAFRIVRWSNWKGINYDLHRVVGTVSLAFTLLFCITGAYFTWPAVYRRTIASVLPVKAKAVARPAAKEGTPQPLDALVASAQREVSGGTLLRVLVPRGPQPVTVVFRHGGEHDNHRTSQVTVDRLSARVLAVDDYNARKAGDHLAGFLGPLHTGHFGGTIVRTIWAVAGLVLPLLFVTGFLMWWNRVLVPRMRRAQQDRRVPVTTEPRP